jgi:hypothetical protein
MESDSGEERLMRTYCISRYPAQDCAKPFKLPGASHLIFSGLGTINVEKTRGFSNYRWIRDELSRLGVPPEQIAYIQGFKKSEAKQRLFGHWGQRAASPQGFASPRCAVAAVADRAARGPYRPPELPA